MVDLHANFRLWIYSDCREGVFGDGKVRLLRAIDEHGSLQEAAKALKISYRKAWGDLKKSEKCLNQALIEKTRGGPGGGRTLLTEHGRKVVKGFDRFRENIKQHLEGEFMSFLGELQL